MTTAEMLLTVTPQVQALQRKIEHGKSVVGSKIENFICISCKRKFNGVVSVPGAHKNHCLWNYCVDCPICHYGSSLAKLAQGYQCQCHNVDLARSLFAKWTLPCSSTTTGTQLSPRCTRRLVLVMRVETMPSYLLASVTVSIKHPLATPSFGDDGVFYYCKVSPCKCIDTQHYLVI